MWNGFISLWPWIYSYLLIFTEILKNLFVLTLHMRVFISADTSGSYVTKMLLWRELNKTSLMLIFFRWKAHYLFSDFEMVLKGYSETHLSQSANFWLSNFDLYLIFFISKIYISRFGGTKLSCLISVICYKWYCCKNTELLNQSKKKHF